MKKSFLVFLILLVFGFTATSWGQCNPYDTGECDTLYIETLEDDAQLQGKGGPYFVRVALYLTTDTVSTEDLLGGIVIPLCYTHTNPSLYCSASGYWNQTATLWNFPTFERSIFRHIVVGSDTVYFNRMAVWARDFLQFDWDTKILDLGDEVSHFWLSLFAGSGDSLWGPGSRVLLLTITFKCQDTMTVCIDTCFWPPSGKLALVNTAALPKEKVPMPGNESGFFEECFTSEVKEIEVPDDSRPTEFSLSQNYPNPFNPVTNFRFTLAKASQVRIEIYNIVGQRVRTLVDEEMKPGVYLADWDSKDDKGNSVSSGIYFYRMTAGDFSDMKKMLLVK